ncbi:ammonium transporter [Ligilactobacillus salitolerans]|uniref:Ammonium transporter n=1 Tax=Ligilactobacillus salitolerans TaxID=1808352 RepID=A0A401IVX1_9LACO|nr:ammonium transporter [Ligilactobacillus salitolerans]GBG95646.1 ammonium transporter [Ligilactobacillus salitolerans]
MSLVNTTFLFLATILVFAMTPGLAFFYGGLVSKNNVVNTMLSVFILCGVCVILFLAVGYEMSFGQDIGGVIGHISHFFLSGFDLTSIQNKDVGITHAAFMAFEMMFAVITPALFVGSIVGRMNFNFLLAFVIFWSLLIYYPLVHMVWTSDGLMASLGVLDFAGGTVVHINAGVTALILSIFLGPRLKKSDDHYNLSWVLLGTAILWIGWYGFNAGSALGVGNVAMNAFLTTTIATAVAMVTWMGLEVFTQGKPTLVGVCTGALCGLVGVTPGTGYVTNVGSCFIGLLCAAGSFLFVNYIKPRLKFDDPLDAFGCHGVSGIIGSILVGAFATKQVNDVVVDNGLFYGGGWKLLGIQTAGTLLTIVFVTIMAALIIFVLKAFLPIRVSKAEETSGLDFSLHGEKADYTVEDHFQDVAKFGSEFKGQLSRLNKK